MRYFNFDSLIDKYSVKFRLVTAGKGQYNDLGDWVAEDFEEAEMTGAILGVTENKVYRSEGVLTEKDKQLYMKEPLGRIDRAHVLYDGNKYSVEQEPNEGNAQFTGCYSYLLKWISVFDKKEADV